MRHLSFRCGWSCRAAIGALLAAAGAAHGQTVSNWVSPVSGDWNDATRWSTDPDFPNNNGPTTFTANIGVTGSPFDVTLNQGITVTNLNLTSGDARLDLANSDLNVEGDFLQQGAILFGAGGTGRLIVDGDATFDGPQLRGARVRTNGRLFISGSNVCDMCDTEEDHEGTDAEWSGNADIFLYTMTTGSRFTNGAASTFRILNDRTASWNNVGVRSRFTNAGTLRKSGGTGVTFFDGVEFVNTGTVEVATGTLRINGLQITAGALGGGTWRVLAGSTLDLPGQNITTNNAIVTLDGAGSTFAAINGLTTNGSTGQFTVSGGRAFTTAGTFTSNGTLTVGSGSQFRVAAGSALTNLNGTRLAQGTFNLAGDLRIDNAQVLTLSSRLTLDGPGVHMSNQSGANAVAGLRRVTASGRLAVVNGQVLRTAAPSFTLDAGAQMTIGEGSTFRANAFTNFATGTLTSGRIDVQGTLRFNNAAITTLAAGLTIGPNGQVVDQNNVDALSALNLVDDGGDLAVVGGRVQPIAASLTSNPTGAITVGSVGQPSASTLNIASNFNQNGPVHLVEGLVNVGGTYVQNGTINGNGTVSATNFQSGGSFSPGNSPGAITLFGNFTELAAGVMKMEIGGAGPGTGHDYAEINGSFTFDGTRAGTLRLLLINGYAPNVGDTFTLIHTTGGIFGEFDRYVSLDIGQFRFEPIYTATDFLVRVVAVPSPGSCGLLGVLGLLGARRRRRG